jgi:hypothetical protein
VHALSPLSLTGRRLSIALCNPKMADSEPRPKFDSIAIQPIAPFRYTIGYQLTVPVHLMS